MKKLVLVRRDTPTRGGQPAAFLAGLVFALLVGALLLLVTGDPVFDVYQRMWERSLGSTDTWSSTFNRAVPLALAGLAVSIAATMGLWNIGAEGQILFGATAATLVGRLFPDAPGPVLIILMLLAAAIGGALWALGPGLARAEIGVSEIITTLMLTEVAIRLITYLEQGPWKDPDGFGFPNVTARPEQAELGDLWDRTHIGVLIALAVIGGFGWFLNRSVWGYELRIAGSSAKTATYAGISMRRKVLGVMLLSGAVAGFAGGIELTGTAVRLNTQISNGYGFAGIIVAALALMRPSGVPFVALAFGAVQVGGQSIQTSLGVSPAVATILQALILFGAIGAAVFSNYRVQAVERQVVTA
ncbi:MAG: ABC transporter permease [Acidimicrobiales bacterium]|nr:ABC transporter permease [Acidimicrobiales bacterium]